MSRLDPGDLTYGDDGLLPVVVQEIGSGAVLMVAWADRDAVEKTVATGDGWFWSRSRREPWRKGATSGNVLSVAEVRADCDADTLIYRVDAAGPACHTGDRTCFDGVAGEGGVVGLGEGADEDNAGNSDGLAPPADPLLELGWLWRVLEERRDAVAAGADPGESYTARLLTAGVERVARKLGEEATETVIAALRAADAGEAATTLGDALGDDAASAAARRRGELTGEAADLVYHLLVLLMAAGATPADVAAELRRRHAAPRREAAPKPEDRPPMDTPGGKA